MEDSLLRLEQLASLQNLTVTSDIATVIEHLHKPLEHYAELEFRSDGRRIDLITLSDDRTVIAAFLQVLEARGANGADLAAAHALLHFGLGKVVGMKLPVAGPATGGEIYIRGALPIDEVAFFLQRHGVKPRAIERLHMLATIFGKSHTHMLASDITAMASFTVFLTTYLTPDSAADQELLRRALAVVGCNDRGVAAFFQSHALLSANRPKTLYYSWGMNEAASINVKVDYANVRLGSIATVLDMIEAPFREQLGSWAELLGLSKANYAGVVVGPDGPQGVRVYFTRCLSAGKRS